jgi:transcriptional regulator with XRE-family HTH domain
MNIGKVIRALRTERGASLETIALDIGTDASNLSRIERGLQQPSEEALRAIAGALQSSVAELYALAEVRRLRNLDLWLVCSLKTCKKMLFRCANISGHWFQNIKK